METQFLNFRFGYESKSKKDVHPIVKQVHGTKIVEKNETVFEADGVYTSKVNDRVFITTADCVPILLGDSEKIMAIHAGWRGAVAGILEEGLSLIPKPTFCWVGPHIRKCCFEVKNDFVEALKSSKNSATEFLVSKENRMFFSLEDLIERIFRDRSVVQVGKSEECTVCGSENLPSFRRNKTTDPQIVTWIERVM